jgi:hypothetical protein
MRGLSRLAWLNSDGRKLLITRMLRTFGYGYLADIRRMDAPLHKVAACLPSTVELLRAKGFEVNGPDSNDNVAGGA